jgi:uncharacterized protein (DUF58 family)
VIAIGPLAAQARREHASGVSISLRDLLALRGEAGRLDLVTRGKILATRSGGHLSRFRGRGMEFDESRVYQPGDDARNMDWRVTARAGTPHVKLFREERERPLWLLVDQGPSMRFGTRVAFKSVVAAQAAALLAWAAADRGDRVGGLVFDEQGRFEHRPAARTQGLLPLLQALAGGGRAAGVAGLGDVAAAADQLVHLARPGSLIFILSDFNQLTPERSAWLARLGRANEVVLVHVRDPLEELAPPPGLYPVTDGLRRGLLDTGIAARRSAWQERFRDHLEMLEGMARQHRAHLLWLSTAEPVGPALARGLNPRRAGGGR